MHKARGLAFPPPLAQTVDPAALATQIDRTKCASIYPAIQNIILACGALGLGTVITTNHLIYEDEVYRVLELPEEIQTRALMPIGYPRGAFRPVRRRPVAEVTMRERFGNPVERALNVLITFSRCDDP